MLICRPPLFITLFLPPILSLFFDAFAIIMIDAAVTFDADAAFHFACLFDACLRDADATSALRY